MLNEEKYPRSPSGASTNQNLAKIIGRRRKLPIGSNLRLFFQPLKNEYRPGLVGFSRGLGMVVKSFLIIVDVLLLILILAVEGFMLVSFLAFPVVTIYLLYG